MEAFDPAKLQAMEVNTYSDLSHKILFQMECCSARQKRVVLLALLIFTAFYSTGTCYKKKDVPFYWSGYWCVVADDFVFGSVYLLQGLMIHWIRMET